MSIPVKPINDVGLKCYHCGDSGNPKSFVYADDHAFCCDGCKTVYELLKENDLCTYYNIEDRPGNKKAQEAASAGFLSLDDAEISNKIIRFTDGNRARVVFSTPGMHCSSCIWLLEHLNKLNHGVISSTVNFPRKEVTIDYLVGEIKLSELAGLMSAIGYPPAISLGDLELKKKKRASHSRVMKIGIAGFCFGNIMLMSFPDYFSIGDLELTPGLRHLFAWLNLVLALPVLLFSASEFFVSAYKTIRYKELNIDAPIALAITVTFLRSVYEISTDTGMGYLDSMSGIVFFMLIGRYFQDRTYENLSFERDYKSYFPIAVTVKTKDGEHSVPVSKLQPGDEMIIRTGELIPADCTLISERASLDYSFVTGEADPISKSQGEKIYAGARQMNGAIHARVEQATSQSYLTQLWNNDAFSRNKEEEHKTYIDSINRWFSLAVILTSLTAGVVWYFIDATVALNAATAVLIVACPCTLLLASTFTHASILKWLGKSGLYLKNANTIDRVGSATAIVFDKTGTITAAHEAEVVYEGSILLEEDEAAIGALAAQSGHPLSRRLSEYYNEAREQVVVEQISEVVGKGLVGYVGGKQYVLGSAQFTGGEAGASKGANVWVSKNGKVLGRFIFHNKFRSSLGDVVNELKGNYHLELLSGDHDAEREMLTAVFGNEMKFNCTPDDKLEHIKQLQHQGKKVIMMGDGLNDAGALQKAEAGIAVSDGVNNYFPACDAVLDAKAFERLPRLLRFTKQSRKIVIASFVISVLYNFVGVYFSVTGQMSPLIAAILMPASSFSVIIVTTLSAGILAKRLKISQN